MVFERVAEYFERSGFEYLALDHDGRSVRLSRTRTAVRSPGVGFVAAAPGRERFVAAGERVREGEALFLIRRFRSAIEVCAPADGMVERLRVGEGEFVEFGQALATIVQTK